MNAATKEAAQIDGASGWRIFWQIIFPLCTPVLATVALFVAVGSEPDSAPFAAVAPVDGRGWFAAGEDCLSGVPGVLVAGDCRAKGVRQLTTAVGDGACAAVAACRYVDENS